MLQCCRNLYKSYIAGTAILPLMAISFLLVIAFPAFAADKEVTLGKTFQISLKANPTTGYKWAASYDKKFLKLTGETYKRDVSGPKTRLGAGGTTTFSFLPVKTGETSINFRYGRPWEKEVAEKKTFTINIRH
ncbi:MAG: protease inhibitor I42 family protein [Desulfomonilaceae bacterium]